MQSKCNGLPFLAFLVNTATPKNLQNDDIYVPAATKRDMLHPSFCRRHIQPSASQWWCPWVCPSWGELTWYWSTLEWRSMAHTTVMCFWLKSNCLQCVRSVLYSLPSNNAMLLLLLIERERQSTFWNDRYQSCFYFTRPLAPNTQIWTHLTTTDGRDAAAGLPSSWCRWSEAALYRCLTWFWAKCCQWRRW